MWPFKRGKWKTHGCRMPWFPTRARAGKVWECKCGREWRCNRHVSTTGDVAYTWTEVS